MHELSIAESVVRIASEHASGRKVTSVELRVGHLRQVVPAALEFSFELVAQGTAVEGATLVIQDVPAAGLCRACGTEGRLTPFPLACSDCGGVDVEVTSGEELVVETLELEDAVAAA